MGERLNVGTGESRAIDSLASRCCMHCGNHDKCCVELKRNFSCSGKLITASFVQESRYHQRFPEAIKSNKLLFPAR